MSSDLLTKSFLSSNPDTLPESDLLSILLSYTSLEDPEERARKLLEHFGSLANLMDADLVMLREAIGQHPDVLALLHLLPHIYRRYLMQRSRNEQHLRDSHAIGNYLLPLFSGERDEMVYLLCLDSARNVLSCTPISQGSPQSASFSIRTLTREAMLRNASAVVLAHNHPNGLARPSDEDINTSNWLREALQPLGVTLLDHIIVADDQFISLRECGYLRPF